MRDGDTIRISVASRSLDIDVPADELARREGPGYLVAASGYLDTFRRDVRDASIGGVLLPRGRVAGPHGVLFGCASSLLG